MHEELIRNDFECIQSDKPDNIYDDYLIENTSVRYIRKGEFAPEIKLKFSKDSLDEEQLNNRKKYPLTGLDLYFSTIETNIAFKEELLKSDKDIEDAKHLRIIYSDKLNEKEIENIKRKIRRLRLR